VRDALDPRWASEETACILSGGVSGRVVSGYEAENKDEQGASGLI
jgi:hypothetical protein